MTPERLVGRGSAGQGSCEDRPGGGDQHHAEAEAELAQAHDLRDGDGPAGAETLDDDHDDDGQSAGHERGVERHRGRGEGEGCEVADAFIHRTPRPAVTLVEKRPKVGLGLPSSVRALLAARLEEAGVRLATGRTVASTRADAVVLADRKGRPAETLPPADLVVLAIGVRAPADWAAVDADPRVVRLGDAQEPATILEAMESGWRVGRSV